MTKMNSKLRRLRTLGLAVGFYLGTSISAPHPESVQSSIFPDEDEIRDATKDLGELGEKVMTLYYRNRHLENGSRLSKLEVPLGAIDTIYRDNEGNTHNYIGNNAWMGVGESRTILSGLIRSDLAKIISDEYEKLPVVLKSIINKSRNLILL